jgi:hypothetical protein
MAIPTSMALVPTSFASAVAVTTALFLATMATGAPSRPRSVLMHSE